MNDGVEIVITAQYAKLVRSLGITGGPHRV